MEKKINFHAKKGMILVVFSVFLISFVSAAQPSLGSMPPLPDYFFGDVNIDGNEALIGTDIEIYVNSSLEKTYVMDKKGEYDLYVKSGNSGDEIKFKIQDILAASLQERQGGAKENLDLSISTVSSNPSSSGSSGGSGGGSSGGGGSGGSSGESVSDSGSTANTFEDSYKDITEISNEQNDSGNETEETDSEEISENLFGITGAVIGFAKSKSGIGLIIGLFALLGIGVFYINKIKPLKWKKE